MTLTKKVNGVSVELSQNEVAEHELRISNHVDGLLGKAIKIKCQEINTARDIVLKKPYAFTETIQGKMREISVDLLQHLSSIAIMDDSYKKPWICVDNDADPAPTLNKAQSLSICKHIIERNDCWVVEARRMKNIVLALTTVADVEAYEVVMKGG